MGAPVCVMPRLCPIYEVEENALKDGKGLRVAYLYLALPDL